MSAVRTRVQERMRERLVTALIRGIRDRGLPLDVAMAEVREDASCVALLELNLDHAGPKTSPEDLATQWLDTFVAAVRRGP